MKKCCIVVDRFARKHASLLVVLGTCLWLAVLGSLANVLVTYANGGRMPVITEYAIDTDRHFSATRNDSVNLIFLSDWIRVEIESDTVLYIVRYIDLFSGIVIEPGEMRFFISPGDIVIEASMFLFAHILVFKTLFFFARFISSAA